MKLIKSTHLIFSSLLLFSCATEVDVLSNESEIIDGTPAGRVDNYPHVVGIFNTRTNSICTGVLVKNKAILTAGHCVTEDQGTRRGRFERPQNMVAYFGSDLRANVRDRHRLGDGVYEIASVQTHPNFDPKKDSLAYINVSADVAVLRLKKNAPVAAIRKIVPVNFDDIYVNGARPIFSRVTEAVGFGKDENGRLNVKLHGKSRWAPKNFMRNYGPETQEFLFDFMVATHGFRGPRFVEACFGDSGGPLFVKVGNETRVAGVVSFGPGSCGEQRGLADSYYARTDIDNVGAPLTVRTRPWLMRTLNRIR